MVDTAVEVVALGDTLEYSMRVEKVKAPADTARLWEGPKRRTTSCTGSVMLQKKFDSHGQYSRMRMLWRGR